MRISGGILSRRTLQAPAGMTTRPTSDRVREALFNILAHRDWGDEIGNPLAATHVLDAFCGTGALAFESLSRGASKATLFDTDQQALRCAKQNADALGVAEQTIIMPMDALHPPKATAPCQLIFLDPPYRKNLLPLSLVALQQAGWFAPHPLIVAEAAKKEAVIWPEKFTVLEQRTYGDTSISFLTLGE